MSSRAKTFAGYAQAVCGVALALGLFVASAVAQDATHSVVPPDAKTIEQQWVAANRPFDQVRQSILAVTQKLAWQGPMQPDWQSLTAYSTPQWYRDAKFGIFIHWGVYSVAAYKGEWYPRHIYERSGEYADYYQHQIATYGPMPKVGYKDLIPLFKAEHFDPNAWATLFREAGARYVVPVAEHHDGFAMYDSKLSDWTAVKMGPHRDVIGELAKAIRAQGMKLGLSSHRAEHDWFYEYGRTFNSDVNDPRYAALYGPAHPSMSAKGEDGQEVDWTFVSDAYLNDWLARSSEIVDDYHPDLMYFDWWVGQPRFRNVLAEFAAFFYNQAHARGQGVVLNYKLDDMRPGTGTLSIERGQAADIRAQPWQTETSISPDSWGYAEGDTYKTPDEIVQLLADVVSKNGNLLLNIGPKADGTIPAPAQHILKAIGQWMHANGEAIYGTRPWHRFGEGPTQVVAGTMQDTKTKPYTAEDFRFTTGNGHLYAIEMAWPASGHALIHSITPSMKVASVTQLGTGKAVAFEQRSDGLHLVLPAQPAGVHVYAYRIELQQPSVHATKEGDAS
ncbi:MAG TPA: alpha-L-fucosidase [Dyella sp.]|uniref:alpha-L-fucosidase n=1 Tax=Dyella sp. TaxID=1869338 RepID=UPI002C720374|nr:alpha-L-fucosidase [Dyella sp.]HTV86875.1 alpha-L-fucosidase [Dyella sp.]